METNDKNGLEFDPSSFIENDNEDLTRRNVDKQSDSLVIKTIKNKKNIENAIKTLAFPSQLWKFALMCFIVYIAQVTIISVNYVICSLLYSELQDKMWILVQQTGEFRWLMEANSKIMQMITVNEYLMLITI